MINILLSTNTIIICALSIYAVYLSQKWYERCKDINDSTFQILLEFGKRIDEIEDKVKEE